MYAIPTTERSRYLFNIVTSIVSNGIERLINPGHVQLSFKQKTIVNSNFEFDCQDCSQLDLMFLSIARQFLEEIASYIVFCMLHATMLMFESLGLS